VKGEYSVGAEQYSAVLCCAVLCCAVLLCIMYNLINCNHKSY
jgi:hypothetical protein